MRLLRELMKLQHQQGFVGEAALRDLSSRESVPLYRLEGLVSFYPHFRRTAPPAAAVHVCRDVVCAMHGCGALTAELRSRLQDNGNIEIHEVSCLGRCETAPAVSINDIPVPQETVSNIEALLELTSAPDKLIDDVPPEASPAWKCDPYQQTADRYGTVTALVGGKTDMGTACIDALNACNLRGMGGAGFPTGRKWELVSLERPEPKYVICNADESEPGTFKDRVILETLPHLVIEGMLLDGLTIGAEQGIVYIRHEYERQRRALEAEIARAQAAGILGENAAGSGRQFDIEIFISPGGYILGEETALLEALEDKRGEPRNKPPYPGTHGLWGKPTLINNVETFALATSIVHHGSDWWNEQAAGNHTGLKFVSISGDVAKPGVFEIPVGTTVAELIERAGGMRNGRPLKAFLPGGASSNFLTAAHANTPLDFEAMQQAGSMLGTGAAIVMDDSRDLFVLATNIVRFFRNESCGKCVPCRIGSEKAVELLEDVQAGKREKAELDVLAELGETMEQTSICGLGQVALNPILSMLKCFPEDTP